MSLQNVTLVYSAKKANGQNLAFHTSQSGTATQLSGTGATRSEAEQSISSQLSTSVGFASTDLQDQQDAQGAFNS